MPWSLGEGTVKAVAQTPRVFGRWVRIVLKISGHVWSGAGALWRNKHSAATIGLQINQAATLAFQCML